MATPPKTMDRRVKRTRQLLQNAFIEALQEKGFTALSINDVTERADVNRGTFYAHFPDKYALLDTIIREQFQKLLVSKLPEHAVWGEESLHLLITVVLEYFDEMHCRCQPMDVMDPLVERSTYDELMRLLTVWLQEAKGDGGRWRVPIETIASVVTWTIFGAAGRWRHDKKNISASQLASDVLLVILDGVEGSYLHTA